jgi:ABC-type nitrate/sulfonate/bicarbonate transport system substrate-binding protein
MVLRALAICVLALSSTVAWAQELRKIDVNSFPGASNLPLWIGGDEGIFKKHGIDLVLSHPNGSVEQIKGIMEGRTPIIITALDNVVAYREKQGAIDLGDHPDLFCFMGLDSGYLTLIAAPEVKTIADFKGKVLAVDALSTGFSFALKEILSRAGLAPDAVSYLAVGSSGERWKALQAGKAEGALLTMPLDLFAEDKGFHALTTVAATLGAYNATVAAAQESWARAHKADLIGFLRGYRDALQWLLAPEHHAAVIAILKREMPNLAEDKLERIFALLTDAKEGFHRDLAIDPAGAKTVLDLRSRYASPPRALPDYRTYVDNSYRDAAMRP